MSIITMYITKIQLARLHTISCKNSVRFMRTVLFKYRKQRSNASQTLYVAASPQTSHRLQASDQPHCPLFSRLQHLQNSHKNKKSTDDTGIKAIAFLVALWVATAVLPFSLQTVAVLALAILFGDWMLRAG